MPPQRLAADPKHPWHDAYWARHADVYVNEVKCLRVALVDTLEGWVEVVVYPYVFHDGAYVTVRHEGRVVIRHKEDASC